MQPMHHLRFRKLNRFCFATVRFCRLQRELHPLIRATFSDILTLC